MAKTQTKELYAEFYYEGDDYYDCGENFKTVKEVIEHAEINGYDRFVLYRPVSVHHNKPNWLEEKIVLAPPSKKIKK